MMRFHGAPRCPPLWSGTIHDCDHAHSLEEGLRMSEVQRRVDDIRHRSSEMENHLIDSYRKGGIDRREFVRRGTVLGMSAGAIGFLASACGSGDEGDGGGADEPSSEQQTAKVQKGGTIKAAINSPAGAIDPITVADDG